MDNNLRRQICPAAVVRQLCTLLLENFWLGLHDKFLREYRLTNNETVQLEDKKIFIM